MSLEKKRIDRLFRAMAKKCGPLPKYLLQYNERGDFLKFVAEPVKHYGEPLDDTLWVYYKANVPVEPDVVGCKLEHFRSLLERLRPTPSGEPIQLYELLTELSQRYLGGKQSRLSEMCDEVATLAKDKDASLKDPRHKR